MKEKTQTITFYGVCIFLFCYFLRIFNMPNELTVILGGALCLVLVIQQKKLRIDVGICLLTITLVSYYVIINGISGLFYSIAYIPLIIYELGNYMAASTAERHDEEKKLRLLIFIMVIGFSIHGLLNSYMWYAGYAVPGTRRWPDFWNGEIVPGTQHAAYFIPVMSLAVPAVLFLKKQKIFNIVLILLTVFFGYTGLATRSRMTILIFVIIAALQIFLYLVLEWEEAKKQLKNKWIWTIIIAFFVLAGIVAFAVKDTPVVVAFINNLGKDGGILNNSRFAAQRLALRQMFDYPMGGYQMDLGIMHMTHNTWLDMLNAAGLIPFFAFAGYTVYSVYQLIRLMVSRNISTETKIMIAGLYGSFLLYFAVEPALEASVHWLTPWIWVNGMIVGWNNCEKFIILKRGNN